MLSETNARRLKLITNYLLIGTWLRKHGLQSVPATHSRREEVWADMRKIIGTEPVLYLEFGVFQGDATRWWSDHLYNLDCELHGFDSFEGLPEDWHNEAPAGLFNVQGAIPKIDDSRVQFFKGWFSDTLPTYSVAPNKRLVINMDADLYSSTKSVLDHLAPYIKRGTLIYFDEFNNVDHELKAFDEFLSSTGKSVRLISANSWLQAVAFEVI